VTTTHSNEHAGADVTGSSGLRTPGWPSSLVAFLLDRARPGDRLPWGARLAAVSADTDAVRLVIERDGVSAAAWIRLRAAGGSAYRTTAHFLIGHEGNSLDAAALRLLDELHGEILRREEKLPASLLEAMRGSSATARTDLPMPIEWLAVRAGVKPAARQVPDGAGVGEGLVAAAQRQGLHAIAVEASAYLGDFATGDAAGCQTILYVGATPEAARAAVDAERAMITAVGRGEPLTPTLNAALGRALGYPECCIASFGPSCDLPNATLRFEALRRTGAVAFALLNDLDPRRSLVSHFVCRYDCAASLRYARAVLDAVAGVDATRARELSRSLEGVVILFHEGGALRLGEARAADGDRYAYGSTTVHGNSGGHERWCDVLADADEVRIGRGVLSPFRNGQPLASLPFDEERVQIRPFVVFAP
jgi:hypothetical protein